MTRPRLSWPLCLALLALLALSVARALQVPEFHRDSQYYVQSALLWPQGKVSFAGSLIGDRSQTVWYYHAFFGVLGASLDALALALATLFLLNGVCMIALSRLLVPSDPASAVVATGLNLVAFGLPLWSFPATEPAFLASNSAVLLAWAFAIRRLRRTGGGGLALAPCGLLIGLLGGFRPGGILFVAGILATLPWLVVGRSGASGVRRIAAPALAALGTLAGYAAGLALERGLWRTWVPVARPPVYRYAVLLFRPIHEHAARANGPHARRTLEEMDETSDAVDYWATLGWTYARHGPAASDVIVRKIGVEAIRAHAPAVVHETASTAASYLLQPSLQLRSRAEDSAALWESSRARLAELDRVRVETSARFGDDYFTRTESLAERRLSAPWALRSLLPRPVPVELQLPGWLLPGACVGLLALGLRREVALVALWVPYLALAAGTIAAASFSQGFVPRYSEPFLYGCVVLLATSVFGLSVRASRAPRRALA